MKLLGLLAFLTVFLLSFAYADSKGKGHHSGLLESEDRRHADALQRRKPPGKPPGPALMADDRNQDSNMRELLDEESKNVYLSSDRNRRHFHLNSHENRMDKDKHKHLVNGVDNNAEESQQERSRSLTSE